MEPDEIYEQLSARVSPARREDVQAAYTRSAKSGTVAFLTCYFLGLVGAHRLYLGDWRGAALRLLVPIGLALVAVAGILDLAPPIATLALAAGVLVIGLIWECIDLTRIDREVQQRNLALAETLIAANGAARVSIPTWAAAPGAAQSASPSPRWRPAPALEAEPMPELVPQSPTWPAPGQATRPEPEQEYQTAPQPSYQPSPAFSYSQTPQSEDAPFLDPLHRSGPQPIPPPHEITQPLPAVSARAQPANAGTLGDMSEPGRMPQSTIPLPAQSAVSAPRAPNRAVDNASPADPTAATGPASSNPFAPAPSPPPAAAAAGATPVEVSEAGREGTVSRPMKRIRVKRRIVVDGEVVGEQVIEELVPLDVDTQVAAAALRARLARMTPEQVAALAKLPPGDSIELREGRVNR